MPTSAGREISMFQVSDPSSELLFQYSVMLVPNIQLMNVYVLGFGSLFHFTTV